MALLRNSPQNLKMDYEDSDASFGNDVIFQNQALINLIGEQPNPFNPKSNIVTEEPFSYAQFLNSGSQPPLEKLVQDVTEAAPPATTAPALAPAVTTAPKTPVAPAKIDYTSALAKQILGQGITDKWSGEGFGSADANAADMAKILAGIGITDISQFGKITKEVPTYSYDETGNATQNGTQIVTTYGNKVTGQEVPNTYSERQTGNFFGGTFSGSGNTGYGVQFDEKGNPYFYTQGASSSDIGKIAPLLTMASFIPGVAPFAQGLNALIAAKQGNILGAALGALGAAGGAGFTDIGGIPINDAKNVLGGINALKTGNVAGLVNSVAGYAGASLPSELGTGVKILNAANAYSKGDYAGLLDAASSLTGSSDAKLAASAIRLTNAVNSGNPAALLSAAQAFGSVVNTASADPKLALGFGPGDPDDFSAGLIPGYFQPGGEGYIPPDEEDPITVQQQPSGLDDFLKQLEQYKQAAVTPDDIQKIISGQNFATIDDIQNAMNTVDIPKGVSEQDVQTIVSQAFAENPGIKIGDVQSIVDSAVSKIPTGVSQDELTRSLGTTEQNVLAKVGAQGEQFQTLFDQYRQLGMDADTALRQTVDDLGTNVGSQFEKQNEQFQTLFDQYRQLGLDEDAATRQTIDDLGSTFGEQLSGLKTDVGSQFEKQGEQFETLLQQYRDLGMEESDAIRQTIDDLSTNVGSQFEKQGQQFETLLQQYRDLGLDEDAAMRQTIDDLGTNITGQISQQGDEFQTLLQQYRDLGLDEDAAIRQTIDDLGADVSGQFSGLESKLTETQTSVDELAQSLGTTREDLLDQLGVTEEEISQRIANLESEFGGNFEDIESSLGATREELLDKFGVTEDEINQRIADLETEFGGNFGDIESSLEKTREDLFSRFGLSEEETAQRIADLESEFGGQLTSGLGKQSAETRALFQNLLSQQQAQEKAAAAQNTALTKALSQVQSTGDFNTLMTLLGSQQQPVQQAPMQDPYAHIKLMEDLFGSEIDLTPAGEDTAKRK